MTILKTKFDLLFKKTKEPRVNIRYIEELFEVSSKEEVFNVYLNQFGEYIIKLFLNDKVELQEVDDAFTVIFGSIGHEVFENFFTYRNIIEDAIYAKDPKKYIKESMNNLPKSKCEN